MSEYGSLKTMRNSRGKKSRKRYTGIVNSPHALGVSEWVGAQVIQLPEGLIDIWGRAEAGSVYKHTLDLVAATLGVPVTDYLRARVVVTAQTRGALRLREYQRVAREEMKHGREAARRLEEIEKADGFRSRYRGVEVDGAGYLMVLPVGLEEVDQLPRPMLCPIVMRKEDVPISMWNITGNCSDIDQLTDVPSEFVELV